MAETNPTFFPRMELTVECEDSYELISAIRRDLCNLAVEKANELIDTAVTKVKSIDGIVTFDISPTNSKSLISHDDLENIIKRSAVTQILRKIQEQYEQD